MRILSLLLFTAAISSSLLEVDKPFRSGVIVVEFSPNLASMPYRDIFPYSNTNGWLVFFSQAKVGLSPSDAEVVKLICAYLSLRVCGDTFTFVSDLSHDLAFEGVKADPQVILFTRTNELIYVGFKVLAVVLLALLFILVFIERRYEKSCNKTR